MLLINVIVITMLLVNVIVIITMFLINVIVIITMFLISLNGNLLLLFVIICANQYLSYISIANNEGNLMSISPTCLREAFTLRNPKSTKRQLSHQCICVLMGSTHAKAAHKTLMKLTPVRPHSFN